ncbi:hypothetical protein NR800_04705 [Corallococcus interemptor]|jgi:hypothetical protein|uniref:hypothetical protein n=1 Tax=Corallococcus TaxID=83461 RepID=UPI001CBFAB2C|nr:MULTISPECIES: hypothetical protein [unclassified Corallococcus]MBZ4334992.1 hypothetical protein [Corallococcus sp. AS-1-12]MBZ4377245.1 hypothetical protein [Corallococcus sp. AS-1-6]
MRKGIAKFVFMLGVVAGGAVGALMPTNSEAIGLCSNLCMNEDCSCFRQCAGVGGGQCVCSPETICQ